MEKIYYLPTHEYIKVDGAEGYIGISEYAAKELGVVTYVDMPEEDDELTAGEEFGAIESRKAASDLYSPVSGIVLEINEALEDNPKLVSENPMENWIIKVSIKDAGELANLMDQAAYDEFCSKEKH
ncbi:MAG: glycine cleavage system protein GcvH [Muribaculaceae bacterium]|nr:glycine cleavage system protein GcvH [Bacteroidales bacterium]MDE6040376.1 glycine cleavage system protein GcvH [Muribaculaceae bacterium]